MSDTLLPYYSRELTYIRTMAAEFARANPAMAERLGLAQTPGEAKDPHVERLIESFAYLTGRIRRKLDDDFPELVNGLLDILYPHWQAPIPSMAIAQFTLDRDQSEMSGGYLVAAGREVEAPLPSGAFAGEKCVYRTGYPVQVFPIEVTAAQLATLPFAASSGDAHGAVASLKISLRSLSPQVNFADLPLQNLRFHLAGEDQLALPLYELIFNHTVHVSLRSGSPDGPERALGRTALKEVGFGADEQLLPFTARSFPGYRLLAEYFAFASKFLFFEIALSPADLQPFAGQLELHLLLDRSNLDLEKIVSAPMLRLGCTPIVNLFKKRADQIELDETRAEYRVVPDRRRPMAHEVYSIDTVALTSRGGRPMECRPFYSFTHRTSDGGPELFWSARRRTPRREHDGGTEMYLSLVDLAFSPHDPGDRVLSAELTCLSRDLPGHLPWGGGQPKLRLVDSGPVSVECITRPTQTLRTAAGRGAMWRLVSHLSLNHLSLGYGASEAAHLREQGAEALREILRLYDPLDSGDTRGKINAILSISAQRVTRRFGGAAAGGACRGLRVTMRFDEDRFADRGLFLFASVLERFLALYASVNSFVELLAATKHANGLLCAFPPRAGEQVLL